MKIALDCPGCGKRYEVDASLAGKKSRCKDCGNTFRIPDAAARPRWGIRSPAGIRRQCVHRRLPHLDPLVSPLRRDMRRLCRFRLRHRSSLPAPREALSSSIVRAASSDTRSKLHSRVRSHGARIARRCSRSRRRMNAPAADAASSRRRRPRGRRLSGRNFAVIPEEVVPDVAEQFVFEPDDAVRSATPPRVHEEPLELGPRRTTYPKHVTRKSRREDVDTEVGVTVAGAYVALGILAFIILAIWHAAGDPGAEGWAGFFAPRS